MEPARRPLGVRRHSWPAKLAKAVANGGVTPNQISVLSAFFAAAGGAAIYYRWFVVAAIFIQLRLLCNLIDGMVAMEGGQKTKSGEVFNDMPDRFSDLFLMVPAGYGLSSEWYGPALGWSAGAFAVLTAYVRVLGEALGLPQSFAGPMAKQHRMAVLTAGCVLTAAETVWQGTRYALWGAMVIIAAGSLITTFTRAARVVRELENR